MSKPATSVHLNYEPCVGKGRQIVVECEMEVKKTANQSYFCCIQFSPGGYCGLQQLNDPNEKVAIFSLWNEGTNNAERVSHGDGVKVEEFGGEGTGLKSMKTFPWVTGKWVKVKVISETKEDGVHTSCYFDDHYMATFRRKGQAPIQSLHSFVEDFNRWDNPAGYECRREMALRGMTCTVDGKTLPLTSARFTKVETGYDKHGKDLTGAYPEDSSKDKRLCLWTGGRDCSNTCPMNTLFKL